MFRKLIRTVQYFKLMAQQCYFYWNFSIFLELMVLVTKILSNLTIIFNHYCSQTSPIKKIYFKNFNFRRSRGGFVQHDEDVQRDGAREGDHRRNQHRPRPRLLPHHIPRRTGGQCYKTF
jgi:hypothetical protein